MAEALSHSAPLASLLKRIQESEDRFSLLRADLPGTLATQITPGPLDDTGWTLLARNGAAAAKLKQCLPRLQTLLRDRGWADVPIRVKVHVTRGV